MTTPASLAPAAPGLAGTTPLEGVPDRVPFYVWTMLGSIAFNMFSGFSQYLGFPIGPDRLLLAATIGLLFLDVYRPRLRWQPVFGVMIALILWTTWSAVTADTITQTAPMFALLDRIAVPFFMFALGPLVFATPRARDLLLRTVTLMCIYLGITAILEVVGPHSLVWPKYIMDPEVGILFGRARGPFASAEPNAMTMGIGLFMAATVVGRTRGLWRVIGCASMALSGLGIVLAMTRSAWLATIIAGLVVGWLVPPLRRRLPVIVAAIVGLFATVLASVPSAMAALDARLSMVSSVYDRQNTNAAGVRALAEHPIFGIGWQKFVEIGTQWVRQADNYPVSNVTIEIHNVFLSRAVETGIPGSAMWALAVIMGPAYAVLRMPRSGEARTWTLILLAALCFWFVPSMTSPNSYPLPNNLLWLVGGISSALSVAARAADMPAADRSLTA